MKKHLSALLIVFIMIFVKSQLHHSQTFEVPSTAYPYFTGPYTIQNTANYNCSGNSLTFDEFGYGSMIAYPTTITFATTEEDIIQTFKNINVAFNYRYYNAFLHEMRIVVRYELSGCFGTPKSGTLHDIFIDNTQFTGSNCLNLSAVIPGNIINMSFCKLKIFFDLYSTSTTGNSTNVSIDNFFVSQTTLATGENLKKQATTYPNPFDKFIAFEKPNDVYRVSLTDLGGRMILEKELENGKLNTEHLQSGQYILTVSDKNGNKSIKKVIKE